MTEIKTPLAGVLQSTSTINNAAAIYDHWLAALNLNGRFVPLTVAQDHLPEVLQVLPKVGFVGLNVARPFQKTVLQIADIVTDRAAIMSGANTLIFRKDGKIHADNTEGYGFIENIRQNVPGWNPKSGPATVFGAGRASREIVAALLEVGAEEIRIANRNRPHAEVLRSEFGTRIKVIDWVRAGNALDGAMTVVNTTPLGSEGYQELRVPLDALKQGAVVCDLTRSPPMTRLLHVAMEAGCYPVDGIGMALCQAAPIFERWFGARPEVDDAARAAAIAAYVK